MRLGFLFPQSIEIHVGDSVTWSNPSPVSEPHIVTFLRNQSYFPPSAAPFNIPNSTQVFTASRIVMWNLSTYFLIPH